MYIPYVKLIIGLSGRQRIYSISTLVLVNNQHTSAGQSSTVCSLCVKYIKTIRFCLPLVLNHKEDCKGVGGGPVRSQESSFGYRKQQRAGSQ